MPIVSRAKNMDVLSPTSDHSHGSHTRATASSSSSSSPSMYLTNVSILSVRITSVVTAVSPAIASESRALPGRYASRRIFSTYTPAPAEELKDWIGREVWGPSAADHTIRGLFACSE